ncbi:hypothetical protein D3C78_1498680 [compost metagenome]
MFAPDLQYLLLRRIGLRPFIDQCRLELFQGIRRPRLGITQASTAECLPRCRLLRRQGFRKIAGPVAKQQLGQTGIEKTPIIARQLQGTGLAHLFA